MSDNTNAARHGSGVRQNVTDCGSSPALNSETSAPAQAAGPTRKCARCGGRFSLKRRRGRNLSGRKRLRPTPYHEGARYCSETCRKLASKARRAALQQPSPSAVKNGSKPHRGPEVLSTVTRVENSFATSMPCEGENQGRASPKKPDLDRR